MEWRDKLLAAEKVKKHDEMECWKSLISATIAG
jgi:hypothetical protein